MKTSGHYWCDHCDEPAFGPQCHQCGHAGRWIPAPRSGGLPARHSFSDGGASAGASGKTDSPEIPAAVQPTEPAPRPAAPKLAKSVGGVPPERAATLFAAIRQTISLL